MGIMMHILPTTAHIIHLHTQGLKAGGSDGLRDKGLLEGALNSVDTAQHYQDMSVPQIAYMLLTRLVKAHAFSDGNKRTAALTFEMTLTMNGWRWGGTDEDLARLVIQTAASAPITINFETLCVPNAAVQRLFDYDTGKWIP